MSAIRHNQDNHLRTLWLAVGLAVIAGFAYVLIAQNILTVGDVQPSEGPPTIVYVAAVSYLIGGLLTLARRRWLWIFGAVINALVILFFFQLYQDRPSVLLSPGGLISKAAQILLEIVLVYLIVASWWRERRSTP